MNFPIFTFVLFFLQDEAHHLLPDPSITPCPWKSTPFNLEKSSHVRGNFGSQLLGSSGATIVPSICTSIVPKYDSRIIIIDGNMHHKCYTSFKTDLRRVDVN